MTIQPDKAAHFGVSASINLACYQSVKKLAPEHKVASLIGCSALSSMVGVAKELSDDHFDMQDMQADALGVGFSAIFLSLDF